MSYCRKSPYQTAVNQSCLLNSDKKYTAVSIFCPFITYQIEWSCIINLLFLSEHLLLCKYFFCPSCFIPQSQIIRYLFLFMAKCPLSISLNIKYILILLPLRFLCFMLLSLFFDCVETTLIFCFEGDILQNSGHILLAREGIHQNCSLHLRFSGYFNKIKVNFIKKLNKWECNFKSFP